MAKEKIPVYKRSLFSWILPGNVKLQIVVVVIIAVTVVARVLPLEMQKRIINQAIRLKELELLYYYCLIFLAAVILANGLKYALNLLQTLISERVLAKIRKQLYQHILTLPLSFFRKTPPGMVVQSLVNELVAAGDFAGTAIA
ncbi:MAG: ABC transporter transmembrane domain-containing protein, partial [Pseudomonadota bacterium]